MVAPLPPSVMSKELQNVPAPNPWSASPTCAPVAAISEPSNATCRLKAMYGSGDADVSTGTTILPATSDGAPNEISPPLPGVGVAKGVGDGVAVAQGGLEGNVMHSAIPAVGVGVGVEHGGLTAGGDTEHGGAVGVGVAQGGLTDGGEGEHGGGGGVFVGGGVGVAQGGLDGGGKGEHGGGVGVGHGGLDGGDVSRHGGGLGG